MTTLRVNMRGLWLRAGSSHKNEFASVLHAASYWRLDNRSIALLLAVRLRVERWH